LRYVLPAIILAIIPKIVKFLEFEFEEDEYGGRYLKETDLGEHPAYYVFDTLVIFFLRGIIPISLMTFFFYKVS
jgi:hypothetical protein